MIHWEPHLSGTDPFTTTETTARGNWYGVNGIPDVRCDGKNPEIGADDVCQDMYQTYRTDYNNRRTEVGGVSPVQITGVMFPSASDVFMTATFQLVDNVSITSLRATLLLYEDNVLYSGSRWQKVVRRIIDQNITLAHQGDQVVMTADPTVNAGWDWTQLHGVAYLQTTAGNRQIYQGALLPLGNFSFTLSDYVRSVPNGNGVAIFDGVLKNTGTTSDTFTLAPGTPFGDWTTDFLYCGDNLVHSGPVDVTLAPNATCNVRIQVHTNGTKEIRAGGFNITSGTWQHTMPTSFQVFNGSYSVLVVGNDGGHNYDQSIIDGLNALGYLHNDWDVYVQGGTFPALNGELGYDVLIWETSKNQLNVIPTPQMNDLMSYLDNGGSLFLTSQYYMNSLNGQPNNFVTNYLGVASWTLDKGYTQLNGVAGDVIGNGITLPLNFQYPSFRRGDDVVPGPNATADFLANDGSHAMIRCQQGTNGPKTVFLAEDHTAISQTDPDPNNLRYTLGRILSWLQPALGDVADGSGALASGLVSVRPNPFGSRTEIAFTLSQAGAAGPVRLDVFDLSGRRVANLVNGMMAPGSHRQPWSGLSEAGRAVESGIYLARLTTAEGIRTEKMILLK